MVNRCVLTVRLKQPFLDWLRSLPGMLDLTLEEVNDDPKVYLLPFIDDLSGQSELLEDFFGEIFDDQLAGYWTVEKDWPLVRTLEVFREWFDVEFHSTVDDLVDDEPLEVDDDEERQA